METVHILGRRDGLDHPLGVQMRGQRQLHQNAVHARIRIQRADSGEQLWLRRIGWQAVEWERKPAAIPV